MKNLLYTGILLLFGTAFFACGVDDTDYDIPAQRAKFKTFLESKNLAYTATRDSIFKHTAGSKDAGIAIAAGDEISIYYVGAVFSSSTNYGLGGVYTTNIPEVADEVGFDPTLLPAGPFRAKIGGGSLIHGLDQGLRGSLRGDTVYLYLTSDLAYNDEAIRGLVNAGTAVVFEVIILEE